MAVIAPVITPIVGCNDYDGFQVTWGPMQSGDTGIPVGNSIGVIQSGGGGFFAGFADKTFQASGTFGAGGSIACEGSNDGAGFFPLSIPSGAMGSAILNVASGAGIIAIVEAVIWIRPRVVGGDGSTSLNVAMFFRKTNR